MQTTTQHRQDAVELTERIEAIYHGRERDALELIRRTVRRMRRSMRQATPTPREGVEAGLDLIDELASGGLGER